VAMLKGIENPLATDASYGLPLLTSRIFLITETAACTRETNKQKLPSQCMRVGEITQALYAHMNKKRKKKE
jgi:hypothetical protein